MADEIPAVDAAEVAALERAVDDTTDVSKRVVLRPHRWHGSDGGACEDCGRPLRDIVHTEVARPDLTKRSEPDAKPPAPAPPKGALETLVEEAVGARMDALEARLARMERFVHHVACLVIVLGDRFNVTDEQYDKAVQTIQNAERAVAARLAEGQ